jgi:hypothetical protein
MNSSADNDDDNEPIVPYHGAGEVLKAVRSLIDSTPVGSARPMSTSTMIKILIDDGMIKGMAKKLPSQIRRGGALYQEWKDAFSTRRFVQKLGRCPRYGSVSSSSDDTIISPPSFSSSPSSFDLSPSFVPNDCWNQVQFIVQPNGSFQARLGDQTLHHQTLHHHHHLQNQQHHHQCVTQLPMITDPSKIFINDQFHHQNNFQLHPPPSSSSSSSSSSSLSSSSSTAPNKSPPSHTTAVHAASAGGGAKQASGIPEKTFLDSHQQSPTSNQNKKQHPQEINKKSTDVVFSSSSSMPPMSPSSSSNPFPNLDFPLSYKIQNLYNNNNSSLRANHIHKGSPLQNTYAQSRRPANSESCSNPIIPPSHHPHQQYNFHLQQHEQFIRQPRPPPYPPPQKKAQHQDQREEQLSRSAVIDNPPVTKKHRQRDDDGIDEPEEDIQEEGRSKRFRHTTTTGNLLLSHKSTHIQESQFIKEGKLGDDKKYPGETPHGDDQTSSSSAASHLHQKNPRKASADLTESAVNALLTLSG